MYSFQERLLSICDDFLTAVVSGTHALQTFGNEWSGLAAAVNEAMEAGLLDDETISLAREASNRVAIYASAFHDLEVDSQELTSDLFGELTLAFSQLTLSNDSASGSVNVHEISISPSVAERTVRTRLLDEITGLEPFEHVYSWLIDNLHNPYPSKAVREAIAHSAKVDTIIISKWFAGIRTQIGWNNIRSRMFGGSRKQTIRAASRFFRQTGCSELSDAVITAFKDMESTALSSLNSVCCASSQEKPFGIRADLGERHHHQLPTFHHYSSPYTPRALSLTSSSSSDPEVDSPRPQIFAVHKRCRSVTVLSGSNDRSELRKPEDGARKRLRHDELSSSVVAEGHAMSPVDSESTSISSQVSTSTEPKLTEGTRLKGTRKRLRESDKEDESSTKRFRAEQEEVDALSDWFKTRTASTLALEEVTSQSILASLDVGVFSDWSSLGSPSQVLPMISSCGAPVNYHVDVPTKAEVEGTIVPEPINVEDTTDASVDALIRALLNESSSAQESSCTVEPTPPGLHTLLPLVPSSGDIPFSLEFPLQIDDDSWLFSRDIPESLSTTGQVGGSDAIHATDLRATIHQHNSEGSCYGTPPPSFEESIRDLPNFGLEPYINAHPYDITTSPPPPYQILESPNDMLYDILWGKSDLLALPLFDASATSDTILIESQSSDTSHFAWALAAPSGP